MNIARRRKEVQQARSNRMRGGLRHERAMNAQNRAAIKEHRSKRRRRTLTLVAVLAGAGGLFVLSLPNLNVTSQRCVVLNTEYKDTEALVSDPSQPGGGGSQTTWERSKHLVVSTTCGVFETGHGTGSLGRSDTTGDAAGLRVGEEYEFTTGGFDVGVFGWKPVIKKVAP